MKILHENKNIPVELEPYIEENTSLHKYFETDFNGIKPKNYCGFLSIDNESYFIVPKITDDETQNLNTFIYMIMYAYNINLKNEDLKNAENKEHQIFEIFMRLFSDVLLD
jgi:5-methylcytosine-specific restriction enzyme subunit McrC